MIDKRFSNRVVDEFGIWVFSDNHDGNATTAGQTRDAVNQIDLEEWDIGMNLGDVVNPDSEGNTPYANYITELDNFTNHSLNQIYHVIGNHDRTKASDPQGANYYYKTNCSPIPGDNSNFSGQPYVPVGNYLYYTISIGNLLIVCLGDDNSGLPPSGEDGLGSGNMAFRASGSLTSAQWTWFKSTIENNTDKIIVVASHIGVKDTTIGTGWREFTRALWRDATIDDSLLYDVDDAWRRGYIAYINNTEGAVDTTTGDSDATNEIKTWLESYGQYIDLWLSGHYHRKIGEVWAGRGRYCEKYGTRFLNCCPLQSHLHIYYQGELETKSNILRIKGNTMKIKTYVHYDPNSLISSGYYAPEEIEITLKKKFIK